MSASKRNKRRSDRIQAERKLVWLRNKLGIKTLDEIKQHEIARVIVLAKGDKVLTAALLGIGKTTVYRSVAEERKKSPKSFKSKKRRKLSKSSV